MPKYEIINETRDIGGTVVYRIKALDSFDDVRSGDLGGFIESGSSLSQKGRCWVYDDSVVMGAAQVMDDAKVRNQSIVRGMAVIRGEASIQTSIIEGYITVRGASKVINSNIKGADVIEGAQVIRDRFDFDEESNTSNALGINDFIDLDYDDSAYSYEIDDESNDYEDNAYYYGSDYDSDDYEDSDYDDRGYDSDDYGSDYDDDRDYDSNDYEDTDYDSNDYGDDYDSNDYEDADYDGSEYDDDYAATDYDDSDELEDISTQKSKSGNFKLIGVIIGVLLVVIVGFLGIRMLMGVFFKEPEVNLIDSLGSEPMELVSLDTTTVTTMDNMIDGGMTNIDTTDDIDSITEVGIDNTDVNEGVEVETTIVSVIPETTISEVLIETTVEDGGTDPLVEDGAIVSDSRYERKVTSYLGLLRSSNSDSHISRIYGKEVTALTSYGDSDKKRIQEFIDKEINSVDVHYQAKLNTMDESERPDARRYYTDGVRILSNELQVQLDVLTGISGQLGDEGLDALIKVEGIISKFKDDILSKFS